VRNPESILSGPPRVNHQALVGLRQRIALIPGGLLSHLDFTQSCRRTLISDTPVEETRH
jgi:hypothetical protein